MGHPKRSGTRISCEIPAALRVHECSSTLAEECMVILVNLQGCAARFNRPVEIGTTVRLEALPGGCANARVVNCISVEKGGKFWLLGLALDEPQNLWGIDTPPHDWYIDVPVPAAEIGFSARAGRS
jgi:hypothetical protein